MKKLSTIRLVMAASAMVLLTGCFDDSIDDNVPEATEDTCTIGYIRAIEDETIRKKFEDKCDSTFDYGPRSGPGFVPSTGRVW